MKTSITVGEFIDGMAWPPYTPEEAAKEFGGKDSLTARELAESRICRDYVIRALVTMLDQGDRWSWAVNLSYDKTWRALRDLGAREMHDELSVQVATEVTVGSAWDTAKMAADKRLVAAPCPVFDPGSLRTRLFEEELKSEYSKMLDGLVNMIESAASSAEK